MQMGRVSRNTELIAGVNKFGRSQSASKHQRYLHSKKAVKKTEKKAEVVSAKQPRWYAADDVKTPLSSRKNNHKQTKLRSTIAPGSVLILLAGRFKGKRVVCLKQLDSGLLLISGMLLSLDWLSAVWCIVFVGWSRRLGRGRSGGLVV